MKKQLLYAIFSRLKEDHPDMTNGKARKLLREEALNSGIEFTSGELNEFMAEFPVTASDAGKPYRFDFERCFSHKKLKWPVSPGFLPSGGQTAFISLNKRVIL